MIEPGQFTAMLDFMASQSERVRRQAKVDTDHAFLDPIQPDYTHTVGSSVRQSFGRGNFLSEPIMTEHGPRWVPIQRLECF